MGFKVFVIWECEITNKRGVEKHLRMIYDYLNENYKLNIYAR